MASSNFDGMAAAVARFCEQQLSLQGAVLGDEYYYQSLPLCVIDAVYSIGVKYEGVRHVVKRYCQSFALQEYREPRQHIPSTCEQEPLSLFLGKLRTLGAQKLAAEVFRNRQRTSTQNGILKSEAVIDFASVLHQQGVNYLQDVPPRIFDPVLAAKLHSVRGQSSGISTRYFFMLAGVETLIKPDRMVFRFLNRCLNAQPTLEEAQMLISAACEILIPKFPNITPRLLDNTIWNFERQKQHPS